MSIMASLVTTSRMQQYLNVFIDSYLEFLLLFYCCVLLEIKLTTTTTTRYREFSRPSGLGGVRVFISLSTYWVQYIQCNFVNRKILLYITYFARLMEWAPSFSWLPFHWWFSLGITIQSIFSRNFYLGHKIATFFCTRFCSNKFSRIKKNAPKFQLDLSWKIVSKMSRWFIM